MTLYKSLGVLAGAVMLTACEKNAVQELTFSVPQAAIRFFNFGLNAPAVNFYANDTKMTAITSATGTESVLGVAYGGVGSGGFYASIAPGPYTITGKIAAATDKDLAVSTLATTLETGKAYSFYMSGIYNTTTKSVEGFVVEDPLGTSLDFSQTYVRFVNAISNSQPMTLFAKNTTTAAEVPVGAPIAYKGAGAFVALPIGVYDLSTRLTGASTNAIARTGVSFTAGKVYTITSRGDITVTSTTAATRPILENNANR
jgi:Domain of unknown function (DUF4397)